MNNSIEIELMRKYIDYANEGHTIKILGIGKSMLPLLNGISDYIYLAPIDHKESLKRGDVVLYYSKGYYLIHRIVNRKGEYFTMLGDGNWDLEYNIPKEKIYLKAVGFQRDGKYISTEQRGYKLYSSVWLRLRRFRPLIWKLRGGIRKVRKINS